MALAFPFGGIYFKGGGIMDMTIPNIEKITGERLRGLPLCDEDIYSAEHLDFMEDDDEITSLEGGFMRGYLATAED